MAKQYHNGDLSSDSVIARGRVYENLEASMASEFRKSNPNLSQEDIDKMVFDKMEGYYVTGHANKNGELLGVDVRRNGKVDGNAYEIDAKGGIKAVLEGGLKRPGLRVGISNKFTLIWIQKTELN